jgi:pilus assembly protein Flp/PilA
VWIIVGAKKSVVMKISNFFKNYWQDDSGATAVEYALVITTLSIVIISAVSVVGGHTTNTWNTVADGVNS